MPELECNPQDFHSPVPTQHVHTYFEDESIGMSVGVWDTTSMQEAFGPYPGDEFIKVLEGNFSMVDGDGGAVHIKEGESVCFRNGIPISWLQEGYLKKFYITYMDPNADTPVIKSADGGVRIVSADGPMERMDTTDPFEIEGPAPVQNNHTAFTNDAGNMFVSTWDSGPMVSKMLPFPTHEFVQMLEGEVTISEENGTVQTFVAGDVFFVPKGTVCSWKIDTYVKKFYAILDAG